MPKVVYAHQDTNHEFPEIKGGDHSVPDGFTYQQTIQHTLDYIRNHQYPRRGSYFDSGAVRTKVWDVTEIAKEVGKNYKHSHMDDFIFHRAIGLPDGKQGKEFYNMEWDTFCNQVNNFISEYNQPKPEIGLSPWQYNEVAETLTAFENGDNVIIADLCARAGKTTYAAAIIVETEIKLSIIASFVLTSFSSFAKEFSNWEQFRNICFVDSKDVDYKEQIELALGKNKQVVVLLSMHGSEKKKSRIDYLFNLPTSRLLIIDEADHGAHTEKQSEPFIKAVKPDDKVILMTGTNSDRAAKKWKVDKLQTLVYPELLLARAEYENA